MSVEELLHAYGSNRGPQRSAGKSGKGYDDLVIWAVIAQGEYSFFLWSYMYYYACNVFNMLPLFIIMVFMSMFTFYII